MKSVNPKIFPKKMSTFTLYDNVWSEAMEAKLMELIISESDSKGNPKGLPKSYDFLVKVQETLNAQFNMKEGVYFYISKIDYLQTMYQAWVSLLHEHGVFWDDLSNTVRASDETWRRIQETNSTQMFYRERGEPHYVALAKLFQEEVFKYLDYDESEPESESNSD
ncbi:uncharacterized protein LOC131022459 [Salvia miltiorrhiza]|uniref:uncharacterized protein LOC131022459 n=1 Tax=Salvia miltiorrhiza TaxID=226208 RepID=UPI0025AB7B35|nr:uncharacterized protein LOC131022459 [Salvia miltiorrhiza]